LILSGGGWKLKYWGVTLLFAEQVGFRGRKGVPKKKENKEINAKSFHYREFVLGLAICMVCPLFALNQRILDMPDNTWLKMTPAREPGGRNYSQAIIGEGEIFYFGGGHKSYTCDDVDFYDLSADTWTQSYTPSCQTDNSTTYWNNSTSRPRPVHTYQQVAWVPDQKVYFLVNYGVGTATFDPSNMTWKCISGKCDNSGSFSPITPYAWQTMHTLYSPDLKAPLAILTSKPYGIYKYDFGTGKWTMRPKATPQGLEWDEIYSTYVASKKQHLVSTSKGAGDDNTLWFFDAVAEVWTPIANTPTELIGCQSLAYDSQNDMVVFLKKVSGSTWYEARMWALHIKTMTWESITLSGPRPYKGDGHTWGSLWYDESHNAFFFLNRTGQRGTETWIYRYKQTPTSVETTINFSKKNQAIAIYPNPAPNLNSFHVYLGARVVRGSDLEFYTTAGKRVKAAKSNGIYFAKIKIGENVYNKRVFVFR